MIQKHKPSDTLGRHFLAEYYDCDPEALNNVEFVETTLIDVAEKIGATIVGHVFHKFDPQGVSGVVVIAESHVSIHTWPEHGYAAVDIFSCSDSIDPEKACELLKHLLRADKSDIMEVPRGQLSKVVSTLAQGD